MNARSARRSGRSDDVVPVVVDVAVLDLLDRSRAELERACHEPDLLERYRTAQLGAVRAAAAVLAARAPRRVGSGPRPVWQVLERNAPALAEWAAFFTGSAQRLRLFERGTVRPTRREADDLVRAGDDFLVAVCASLGLPLGAALPDRLVAL